MKLEGEWLRSSPWLVMVQGSLSGNEHEHRVKVETSTGCCAWFVRLRVVVCCDSDDAESWGGKVFFVADNEAIFPTVKKRPDTSR